MKTTHKYYKNSNTGAIIQKQTFTETKIKFPVNYYDENGTEIIGGVDFTGFVEISEKTFKRICRKLKAFRKALLS